MDSTEAFSTIAKSLQPGEKIIWQGTPAPWIAARRFVYPLIFIPLWAAGIFLWFQMIWKTDPRWDGGVSLLALGTLVAMAAYSWWEALRTVIAYWKTAYTLTDRRVIIAADGNIQSFNAATLGDISRTGSGSRGSLTFGSATAYSGLRSWNLRLRNGLYGISDPAQVEALIYQTLNLPQRERKGTPR